MSNNRYLTITIFAVIFYFSVMPVSFGATQDEINQKSRQIEEIQRQIDQYQQQINSARSQSQTLQSEVNGLNAKINQIALEIKSLGLSISKTNLELGNTQTQITEAEEKISKDQEILGQYLRVLYQNDQESLTTILLKNETLSEFFNDLNSVKTTQESLKITIDSIEELKESLEIRREELEEKRTELEQQQKLEQLEKQSLDQSKAKLAKLLKETKGQESKYQELVKRSQQNIARIREEVQYLQQIGVTVEDAIKYGNLAAIATGIRPAYLIAVLEVESGLGRNVGRCNRPGDPSEKQWQNIMHKRDHQPFLKVTSELGLDPQTTAVSCPQYVSGRRYGWGGAMGPAQFIPSTWVAYASEVSRIVGRTANPWNIQDAFTAAAVKLARGGAAAKTRPAEVAASKAYYSGNSRCATAPCNSYANAIQRVAAELEQNL